MKRISNVFVFLLIAAFSCNIAQAKGFNIFGINKVLAWWGGVTGWIKNEPGFSVDNDNSEGISNDKLLAEKEGLDKRIDQVDPKDFRSLIELVLDVNYNDLFRIPSDSLNESIRNCVQNKCTDASYDIAVGEGEIKESRDCNARSHHPFLVAPVLATRRVCITPPRTVSFPQEVVVFFVANGGRAESVVVRKITGLSGDIYIYAESSNQDLNNFFKQCDFRDSDCRIKQIAYLVRGIPQEVTNSYGRGWCSIKNCIVSDFSWFEAGKTRLAAPEDIRNK